jgi:hypothetical protein
MNIWQGVAVCHALASPILTLKAGFFLAGPGFGCFVFMSFLL